MALAYCLRSCRLPTSASGVDHVGSSAYQLTTLQPFSSEHRNNTCNGGFFINKVLGRGRRQISLRQVTFVITSSHGSPTVWSQREINTIYMDISILTHGISCNPPHANAGDPSEIIREGAGSDARSIDLKVVPCTPHYATNIRAFRYEPHAKASLNMALVNPVCRFAQVSVSLLDVIFNFNWPGRRKIRILAPTCSLCIMAHKTSHKTSYPSSDITHGSFLDHSIQTH
ncbi:hypothetical protein ALC60_02550 [Trachymyrmex zeteki]|uniref:Uncharacterized protein n=1 Tax=Mycetomoellerius zeteki TaxID=64791 RepID=A0A151XDR5_9HYME|nr:hypothetical protein ALC60_02550 [Trachymyrmex zeteki]